MGQNGVSQRGGGEPKEGEVGLVCGFANLRGDLLARWAAPCRRGRPGRLRCLLGKQRHFAS